MDELDHDFGGDDILEAKFDNQIEDKNTQQHPNNNFNNKNNTNNAAQDDNNDDDDDDEDDDLDQKPKNKYKELDDSGDELEEQQKNLQKKFKNNFDNLFANKHMMKDTDVVVQEEEYDDNNNNNDKIEPFNLKDERRSGYFDQFLNYHDTAQKESDPFYKMMDFDKQQNNLQKYKLSDDIIKKHKNDYNKYENAKTDINIINEWKSLLPLFENNTQTVQDAIKTLSENINKYKHLFVKKKKKKNTQLQPNKRRKLNNNKYVDVYNKKQKNKNKKKQKRAWELSDDDDNDNNDNNNNNDIISEREFEGLRRKFDLFSEKATMLVANDDHDIYQQNRNSLIKRIKLVENEELFKKHQTELRYKYMNNVNNKNADKDKNIATNDNKKIETVDDLLADFSDDDDDDDDDDDINMNSTELIWEYRWKNSKDQTKYGPFSNKQMYDWNTAFFKTQPIMFKNINHTNWMCSDQVDLIQKLKMCNK